MDTTSYFGRRRATLGACAVLLVGPGLLAWAASAPQAVTPFQLTVLPNHVLSGGTTKAGHGHGGGGDGGGGSSYWKSSNWSGYAVTGKGPYTNVTGSWTVPAVQRPRKSLYGFSAAWVGIDGFLQGDASLIQTGTEQDYFGGASYNAWWTSSAQGYAEQVITSGCTTGGAACGQVAPGDAMSASITLASGSGTITLADSAAGHAWSYTTTIAYSGPATSAEWIMEAPSSSFGVLPLANYGTVTFDPGTVNGVNPGLVASDGGELIQNGNIVSIPSSPDGDTDGFTVAYGSTPPSTPSS